MKRFTTILASCVLLLAASNATAALDVAISSSDDLNALTFGQEFTLDITVSTTSPEAVALGLRLTNWDSDVLAFVSATAPTSIFDFSPSVPFGGISNILTEPVVDGVGPGNSVNLFQGVTFTPSVGNAPESFSVTFRLIGFGRSVLHAGVFDEYQDAYIGGDNVVNNATVVFPIPEPTAALMISLGLGVLSARRHTRGVRRP